jgi:hypothetical protein
VVLSITNSLAMQDSLDFSDDGLLKPDIIFAQSNENEINEAFKENPGAEHIEFQDPLPELRIERFPHQFNKIQNIKLTENVGSRFVKSLTRLPWPNLTTLQIRSHTFSAESFWHLAKHPLSKLRDFVFNVSAFGPPCAKNMLRLNKKDSFFVIDSNTPIDTQACAILALAPSMCNFSLFYVENRKHGALIKASRDPSQDCDYLLLDF